MGEIWYDVVYEANEEGESYLGPKVLYTSAPGLQALATALQAISTQNQAGRFAVQIPNLEDEFDVPFSHVEVATEPPAQQSGSKDDGNAVFYWILGLLVAMPLLALYGLVRLVIDIF